VHQVAGLPIIAFDYEDVISGEAISGMQYVRLEAPAMERRAAVMCRKRADHGVVEASIDRVWAHGAPHSLP
jgi:hypothetical protein